MSERGVFAVDRGIWDHDCFADEPFTEREAWMWLVGEAAWKDRTRRVGDFVVNLQRGQLAASFRYLADQWGWSKDKVGRFLSKLKNRDMIETQAATGISVITINNYDSYQKVSLPDATQGETQTATGPRQDRDKTENIKTIEDIPEAKASGADAPIDPSIAEREFFRRGREVLGKSAGGQLAKLKTHFGGNVALARASIETASTKDRPAEYIAAVIRGPPVLRPLTAFQQRQAETNDVRSELRRVAMGGGSGGAANWLLPDNHGERSEGLRDGPGAVVLDLSAERRGEGN